MLTPANCFCDLLYNRFENAKDVLDNMLTALMIESHNIKIAETNGYKPYYIFVDDEVKISLLSDDLVNRIIDYHDDDHIYITDAYHLVRHLAH